MRARISGMEAAIREAFGDFDYAVMGMGVKTPEQRADLYGLLYDVLRERVFKTLEQAK